MKYAVIDVSSSSMSFIVATVNGSRREIIFRDRIGLSLYHYLEGKTLSARGMEKLIETVLKVKEKCVALGVDEVCLISTAALRAIDNFDEVQTFALERTGMKINLLDGETEAYCDYIANESYSVYGHAVLIDLGGASIEICDLSESAEDRIKFLDFGTFDLSRKFVKKIQPTESEAKDIKEYLKEKYAKANLCKDGVYSTAILVGATNGAIYDVYRDFVECNENECGRYIDVKKFKKFAKAVVSGGERSTLIMNNAPERVYILGAAVITLKTLLKRFDIDKVIVSELGVKEGYLKLLLDGKTEGEAYALSSAASQKGEEKPEAAKPKRTYTRKTAAKPAAENKPKRRYTRRKVAADVAKTEEKTESEGKENDGEKLGDEKEE